MESWKDNIHFILVEPKEAGNIGASARAMKNMGFKNLELVRPKNVLTDEARWMACNAVEILGKAVVYKNFEDAIKDKNIIIGTTRRLGKKRGLILPLKESIKKIIPAAKKNKIAILFGREDKGLLNNEVEACGLLITIPTSPSQPSLNLAQSVMLVAYELAQNFYKKTLPELAAYEDLEALYKRIQSVLKLLEYIPKGDRNLEAKIMRNLKHLIGRTGLTDWELRMLHGFCSQVAKKLKLNNKAEL